MNKRLTWYILFALVLGVITGWAVNAAIDDGSPESAARLTDIAGYMGIVTTLFLRLIKMIIAPVIGIFSFPLPSMLLALDRPDAPLKARLVGSIVYFALIAPLCLRFGVTGAAAAFVAGYAAMALTLIIQVRAEYRRKRGPARKAP